MLITKVLKSLYVDLRHLCEEWELGIPVKFAFYHIASFYNQQLDTQLNRVIL